MQRRLQAVLKENYNGELPVGQATIIKTFSTNDSSKMFEDPKFNEGKLIKYLISAPTMRVPLNVTDTVNAYLAFRAVIIAGKYNIFDSLCWRSPAHNRQTNALASFFVVFSRHKHSRYQGIECNHGHCLNPNFSMDITLILIFPWSLPQS